MSINKWMDKYWTIHTRNEVLKQATACMKLENMPSERSRQVTYCMIPFILNIHMSKYLYTHTHTYISWSSRVILGKQSWLSIPNSFNVTINSLKKNYTITLINKEEALDKIEHAFLLCCVCSELLLVFNIDLSIVFFFS